MQTAPLLPRALAPCELSPLLILDAGEFQARCRRCGWKSPHELTPGAARAAFAAHACEEPA